MAALAFATACSAGSGVSDSTLPSPTSTTSTPSTTIAEDTTTTSHPVGGHLVRLDPLTLEGLIGFDPIPYAPDSWNLTSEDGSIMVNFECDNVSNRIVAARAFDTLNWLPLSELEVEGYAVAGVDSGSLYTLSDKGVLTAHDLATGEIEELVTWPVDRWPWDDLHHLDDDRIAALMTYGSGSQGDVVLIYDPATKTTGEIPVGEIVRTNPNSGVFDGDYEIPDTDLPGVVWLDSRVLVVHADPLEILEVDLDDGGVRTHLIDTTSWWSRFISNWFPKAVAKGPSLGTYSSAALAADGRHLFISGNRVSIEVAPNGHIEEFNEPLGLTVVDLETWAAIDAPDVGVQFVRNDGGKVLGVSTVSQQPWEDELFVLDVDSRGAVTATGPFIVRSGGCQLIADAQHLICTEQTENDSSLLRVVSIESGETVAERSISVADYFHPNGVLEDWAPISP